MYNVFRERERVHGQGGPALRMCLCVCAMLCYSCVVCLFHISDLLVLLFGGPAASDSRSPALDAAHPLPACYKRLFDECSTWMRKPWLSDP